MTNGDVTKNIKELTFWRTVLPMLSLVAVNTLMAPINTFIASGVSSSSVESVGTAGTILNLFSVLLSLLTGGSIVVMGQYIGKGFKNDKIKKVVDSTFFVSLMQGIFLVILVVPLATEFLKWWGVQSGTQQMHDGQIYIWILGSTFILISLQGYFTSVTSIYGHPRWSMIIGIGTTLIDAAFSSIFVFAAHMGVMGVIMGTVVARVLGLLVSIWCYSKYVQSIFLIRVFDRESVWKIVKISIPIAGEKINWSAGQFIQGILIGQLAIQVGMVVYDHNYMLWARAIFGSIQSVVVIAGAAFGLAVEQLVSRKLGEGDIEMSKKYVQKAIFWAIIIDVIICVIVFFASNWLIDFLTTKETNKEAVTKLKHELHWSFIVLIALEVGRCANLIYVSACRAAGDAKYTAYMSVPVTWISQILIVWILVQFGHMGWMGVAIGLAIDECGRGLINYLRWKSNKWIEHSHKLTLVKE